MSFLFLQGNQPGCKEGLKLSLFADDTKIKKNTIKRTKNTC